MMPIFSSYSKPDMVRMAVLALAYFVTAKLGIMFATVDGMVTLFWPPSGIALAALLLFGRRLWPGIFVAVFLVNLSAGLAFHAAIGIALGGAAATVFGAFLLGRQSGFHRHIQSVQDVLRLLIFGALLSTLLSAANGAFWLAWPEGVIPWELYGRTFLFWWMGDALGVMLFAPAVIAFYRPDTLQWTPALRREALLMFAVLILLCLMVFTDFGQNLFGYRFRAFTIFPVIIWAAFVFNLRIVSAALLVVYGISLASLLASVGRFGTGMQADAVDVWLFNGVLGVVGLCMVMVNEQRKRDYDELKQSERNFKRAQRVVYMGSWQLDLRHNELTWSDEAYAMFGLPHGQPVSYELFLNCVHPDDRKMLDDAWQAALRGAPYDIEHRIVVNGQIKWVRETAEMDFDPAGLPTAAFGTVRDITRRKHTEDSLRLAASVFEGSGEAILVTDAEVRILSVNQAFTRMSGYTLDEVKGKSPRILSSGKHDAEFYRAMWEAINRDGFWQGEIWDRHKGGRIYPMMMTVSAIRGESGEVTNYMSIASDISERKEAEKNIHALAYYDVLTGLPNRSLLRDRIEQMVAAAHRDRKKFALLFVDLDRFKYVNDTLGHAMGDRLLQVVAQRLLECARAGDTVSRIGGDEFIVLLRETDADGAALVAEKILKSFATVSEIEGISISTNGSIGISIYPDHAVDADALIKNADAAMYFAKQEGRNNFQFYRPELNFQAQHLFSMEADLRLALERNEFILHYQPQLDLTSGKVCGAEVLVRWNHPQKGLISPAEFIPVAEETGQILPLGEWVLRTACAQLAAWRRQGMAAFPVSVNLSVRQLRQAHLAQLVVAVLEEAQLQPGDLELELTESIMLGDALAAMAFLTRMHELGVRLAIDDFGTGFSSLSYLKRMPLDRLKIDQSFVRDLETDESDAAIVRSIISLGHSFKLRVIAEGVETQEQMDFLRVHGCDEIQGYYFCRPLLADEFAQFVRSKPTLD